MPIEEGFLAAKLIRGLTSCRQWLSGKDSLYNIDIGGSLIRDTVGCRYIMLLATETGTKITAQHGNATGIPLSCQTEN